METKNTYYNNIVTDLFNTVPEFESVFDLDDGVYPIFGEFGRYLISNLKKNNSPLLARCFNFISLALNKGCDDVEDLIVLEVFQILYEDEFLTKEATQYLDKKTLSIFNKFLIEYNK